MTIQQLHIELRALGIPEDRYYLHGLYGSISDEGKISMIIRKGVNSLEYEVYYRERGEKHSAKVFLSEVEACGYVYHQLITAPE